MLDNHPQVGVPLESLFIIDYLNARQPPAVLRRWLVREYELREWGLECSATDLRDCDSAAAMIDRLHALYLTREGKMRWGQKTPRFIRYGELLRRQFPGAKFVHVTRDPRAVARSLVRSDVHRSTIFHAAQRWRSDVAAGLALERGHPQDVFRISYEDLVRQPESTLRQVCQFLNLEFVESMLDFHKRAPAEYGSYYDRIHSGLGQPVSLQSVAAWKDELTAREVALIESIDGGLMDVLGYQRQADQTVRLRSLYVFAQRARRFPRLLGQARHYLLRRTGYLPCVIRRKLALRTAGPVPINR